MPCRDYPMSLRLGGCAGRAKEVGQRREGIFALLLSLTTAARTRRYINAFCGGLALQARLATHPYSTASSPLAHARRSSASHVSARSRPTGAAEAERPAFR